MGGACSCRQTDSPMPQLVLARPSWSAADHDFCSLTLDNSDDEAAPPAAAARVNFSSSVGTL